MQFVKAKPSEYLVVGERGEIKNLGIAASAYLWRRSSYVFISSTQQEATFEMTQESSDGVPLRFKGIVIYRINAPEVAAKRFDFSTRDGREEINKLIGHVCLGELRAVVSSMRMKECIEERKTTLTNAISSELEKIVENGDKEGGWGIELDVVQVAQVFIVDDELRQQLDAGVRNEIKAKSDLSDIQLLEEVELAEASSRRKINEASLETERQRVKIAREKILLEQKLEQERIEARRETKSKSELAEIYLKEEMELAQILSKHKIDQSDLETERKRTKIAEEKLILAQELKQKKIETETPIHLLGIEKASEIAKEEIELRKLENKARELEVQTEILLEKAKMVLDKEILPIKQMPAMVASASQIFQGSNLSIYGENEEIMKMIAPLADLLTRALKPVGTNQQKDVL